MVRLYESRSWKYSSPFSWAFAKCLGILAKLCHLLDSDAILRSFDEKLLPTLALSRSVYTPILFIAFIKSDLVSLTLVLSSL